MSCADGLLCGLAVSLRGRSAIGAPVKDCAGKASLGIMLREKVRQKKKKKTLKQSFPMP